MKKINIRESLLQIDRDTDCQYDLTTLYESIKLTEDEKKKLVQYLDGPTSPEDIGKFMTSCGDCPTIMVENCSDDLEEAVDGSVEYFLKKMKTTDNPSEASKVHRQAKGNPNADEAYAMYLRYVKGWNDFGESLGDNADWKCDDEQETQEWFDNYRGPGNDMTEDLDDMYESVDELDNFNLEYQHNDDEYSDDELASAYGGDTKQSQKDIAKDMDREYLDDQEFIHKYGQAKNESLNEAINQDDLTNAIKDKLNDYLHNELGYGKDFINDYVFVEVKPSTLKFNDGTEDDRIKVEVRAELSYEEMDDLATALDKVIVLFDKEAYFEQETSGIIQAYVRTNSDEDIVDHKIVKKVSDTLKQVKTREELIKAYKDLVVSARDSWSGSTTDAIYKVVDEMLDKISNVNESLDEDTQTQKIATDANGNYLVKADSGKGFSAFNKDDVAIGGIDGDDINVAKQKFMTGKLNESNDDFSDDEVDTLMQDNTWLENIGSNECKHTTQNDDIDDTMMSDDLDTDISSDEVEKALNALR